MTAICGVTFMFTQINKICNILLLSTATLPLGYEQSTFDQESCYNLHPGFLLKLPHDYCGNLNRKRSAEKGKKEQKKEEHLMSPGRTAEL